MKASSLVKLQPSEEALPGTRILPGSRCIETRSLVAQGKRPLWPGPVYPEALEAFEKTIALDPENNTAWYRKGKTHAELGNPEEAIACFEKVLPNDQSVAIRHGCGKGVHCSRSAGYEPAVEALTGHWRSTGFCLRVV